MWSADDVFWSEGFFGVVEVHVFDVEAVNGVGDVFECWMAFVTVDEVVFSWLVDED